MLSLNIGLINKAIDIAIEDLRKQKQDVTDIASILWDIKRYEETKEQLLAFKQINEIDLLNKHGGQWLGTTRNWIQCKCVNGEDVTWGSQDQLKVRNGLTVIDLERFAAKIAAHAINEVFGSR